ncbi:MAG TPA: hypothetical protein VHN14_17790 [Kofleriaceae bacterium]|jgi:antitoxin (DNA-binding transcriptional repressor) of toxin-antitoxin stability system|nr:hypothetical protein [Kofleriaceae bacterium]
MIIKDISGARAQLLALMGAVRNGEEVLIREGGVWVAKLVRHPASTARRMAGALKGQIEIREGFDELPPDIAAVFGIES